MSIINVYVTITHMYAVYIELILAIIKYYST